ncbi:hypothetical protein E4Z66_02235 [Aliishimia ponticola]|uniref:Sulfotransferase family protein n=1 Tax=Aliishimia ponticola TaxID=2499833 RepID=A0A4S4NJI6_9RHOB|nr:hypothetical protein [Aliishimia ponticola]THH38411.1 hypothetical protein E4Z66_02235 [Aliishimia ponticola]
MLLSAWGTGSTSVAGYLDRCGVYTCPPHQETIDERTPNAYEPQAYRAALADVIDEFTLEPKGDADSFRAFLEPWIEGEREKAADANAPMIALKHPLQTYLLPVLEEVLRPRYVLITRPFADIEATRQRRVWHPVYGEAGAQQIYGVLYTWLHDSARPYLGLPYAAFRSDPGLRRKLLEFLDLDPPPDSLRAAEDWVR